MNCQTLFQHKSELEEGFFSPLKCRNLMFTFTLVFVTGVEFKMSFHVCFGGLVSCLPGCLSLLLICIMCSQRNQQQLRGDRAIVRPAGDEAQPVELVHSEI